jgi:aminoglycoside phosphotransferase (APT) family kinase protein
MMAGEVAGVDVPKVTEWLRAHEPEVRPPLSFARIAGGRSNLTYRVEDADGRVWVLRRPPLGLLLPSAHDMTREYRLITALAATSVPVPPVIGLCTDETVNGVPFYVMRFVDGVVLRDAAAAAPFPEDVRRAASESLVDVLADLHGLDPDAVGLGDLGRREGYVQRLLARWSKQWEASRSRDLPVVAEVADRLARRIPACGQARVVHGDYSLHNVLVSPETGVVQAALDWELGTLGDPLADLGWLLVIWVEPTDDFLPVPDMPTVLPGFPARK